MSTLDTRKAAYKDVYYYSGDNISYSFYVTDQDGLPVDLSAVEVIMQVKRKRTDPESKVVAQFRTDDGTMVISGASGNLVTLSGDHALGQDIFYHDMERQDIPETVMYGKFITTGDVTRV